MITIAKYDFSTEEEFIKLAPYFYKYTQLTGVEKEVFINYMEVLANSMTDTQEGLFDLATKIKTFLTTTGQHLSLESLLNDTYDASLRRIVITENDIGIFDTKTWFLQSESDPENKVWYLQGEADPLPKTWYLQSEIVGGFNFTIEIPLGVVFDEAELRSLLDNYVISGVNYNIIIV